MINPAAARLLIADDEEHGAELNILVQKRRDKAAAKRFFKRGLRSSPVPSEIVTDQLRSHPAAKAEIPELVNVKHGFVKAAARLNNRAENSHQPTRDRERRMRGFRDPKRTQKFLWLAATGSRCGHRQVTPIPPRVTRVAGTIRQPRYRKQDSSMSLRRRSASSCTSSPRYQAPTLADCRTDHATSVMRRSEHERQP